MDLIVVDDSKQSNPRRKGMGPLIAVGGLHVPGDHVRSLETELNALCEQSCFPPREEFKWSPHRGTWMHESLHDVDRTAFQRKVLDLAIEAGARAIVVIEDEDHGFASKASKTRDEDVTTLFLERTDHHLRSIPASGLVLADQPGGQKESSEFVSGCLATMRLGTEFVHFERVSLVVTGDSKTIRLLQLADLVVGCTLARVSGEDRFSPPVFDEKIRPMLRAERGRKGGVGLKLHPDAIHCNLYYWLLGDSHFQKRNVGIPLPIHGRQYSDLPTTP